MLKKISFVSWFLVIILCSVAYANFMVFKATEMNVTIENINEEINSVYLVIYDDKCNLTEAYKDSYMDFKDYEMHDFTFEGYKSYATMRDIETSPFGAVDKVKFNENYDKKNYVVEFSSDYVYEVQYSGTVSGSRESEKYATIDELKKYFLCDEKADITEDMIKCKRIDAYSANRLVEIQEIDLEKIENNQLKVTITDFSELDKYREYDEMAGFALRFENKDGEYKTLKIGSNDILRDSHIKRKPSSDELKRNIVIDYISQQEVLTSSYEKSDIVHIIFAIAITLISELFVAKIMKINYKKVIIIVNIITQLLLHLFTYCILSHIYSNINFACMMAIIIAIELLIVDIEGIVYIKTIKKETWQKLLTYSFLANLVSFGFSIILYGIIK